MASTKRYTWQPLDSDLRVASRFQPESGWADVPTFLGYIINANLVDQPHRVTDPAWQWQGIYDWNNVTPGRVILLPYKK